MEMRLEMPISKLCSSVLASALCKHFPNLSLHRNTRSGSTNIFAAQKHLKGNP